MVNSSGRCTYTTASSTISEMAMLKVNSASSTGAASGTISMASMAIRASRGAQAVAQQLHDATGIHRGGLGAHALAPLPNSSTSSEGNSGIGPPFQPRSW